MLYRSQRVHRGAPTGVGDRVRVRAPEARLGYRMGRRGWAHITRITYVCSRARWRGEWARRALHATDSRQGAQLARPLSDWMPQSYLVAAEMSDSREGDVGVGEVAA